MTAPGSVRGSPEAQEEQQGSYYATKAWQCAKGAVGVGAGYFAKGQTVLYFGKMAASFGYSSAAIGAMVGLGAPTAAGIGVASVTTTAIYYAPTAIQMTARGVKRAVVYVLGGNSREDVQRRIAQVAQEDVFNEDSSDDPPVFQIPRGLHFPPGTVIMIVIPPQDGQEEGESVLRPHPRITEITDDENLSARPPLLMLEGPQQQAVRIEKAVKGE